MTRLARIGLNSADPDRLAAFYEAALGFERIGRHRLPSSSSRAASEAIQGAASPDDEAWIASLIARDDGGEADHSAHTVTLRLGDEIVDLTGFTPGGAAYPGDVPGWSPLFQHCAIIVSDMEAAMARLSARSDWQPISTAGPERLPEASGGVTAFKFRDPEGHPLEFLEFPAGRVPDLWRRPDAPDVCLGIDHSAISVAETERSVRFYEGLGFSVTTRSHNLGPEQARMDAVPDPDVAVTGLSFPGQHAPHVELLCYRGAYDRAVPPPRATDIAGTRLVLAMADAGTVRARCPEAVARPDGQVAGLLRDPDGHLLVLTAVASRLGA